VLLAPAFRMAERWSARIGEEAWREYERSGWAEAQDYAEKRNRRVDFGFFEDVSRVDARSGGWPDVRVPTLIVHGVRDDVVGVDLSRTWAAGKRHVRLVEADDGHELAASLSQILQECVDFITNYRNR
jgi:pimeloyl-ACP methyl ester carboxylesterase